MTFSTMSQMGGTSSNVIWLDTGYSHDSAVYGEKYENSKVRPKVYLFEQVWRTVTQRASGESSYWKDLFVCIKGAGRIFNQDHAHIQKCGSIRDTTDGGIFKADSNFFTINLSGGNVTEGGDSGGGWYYYLGSGNVRALGIHHGLTGSIGIAEKTYKIEDGCSCIVRTSVFGDG